jgi:transposase
MQSFAAPVQKINSPVVGLDVHQRIIAWCRLDRRGHQVAEGSLPGSRAALEEFLKTEVGRAKPHFALEACGGFLWVYDRLVERFGRERVHLAQPRRIQMIANSSQKNDRHDAFWLAYLTYEGRLPEAHVPAPTYRELRIASRERIHVVQRRSDAVRRLKGHLRQMGEKMPTQTFDTKSGRAFLEELLTRTTGLRAMALRECLMEFDTCAKAIERWEAELDRLAEELPEAGAMRREIPGVGRVLSATILAETGSIQRFRSPKALGRFTGLTPSERSTGGETIHGSITREGSRHLRWALMQAVIHCLGAKRGPELAVGDWTRARTRRLGGLKARTAAARKLAESIWRLFHHGEAFEAARPFGGPALERPALRTTVGLA